MHRSLASPLVLAAAALAGGGCAAADARPGAGSAPLAAPTSAMPASATSTSRSQGLFAGVMSTAPPPPSSAHAAVLAPPPTITFGVPPLPADLVPVRPAVADSVVGDDHEHDGDGESGDVASAWVVAMFTARFDDAAGAAEAALGELAASPELVAATLASLPVLDVAAAEARWPIVTAVSDAGGGRWRVLFVLKHTRSGQVGPTTSD